MKLSSLSLRTVIAINLSLGAAVLLTGCGIGERDTSTTPETVMTTITGRVHGGEQPISGSTVQLWVTGTTGYGTGATQLIASTTSAVITGGFQFPTANVPANCTGKGPYAYITASGGDPTGQTTTTSPNWTGGNHAILLAAMLGSCSSVGASTIVDIDEVTTVAVAYALGNFATVSGAGGSLASLNIGAPTSNTQGLADAAANSALLVNPSTGMANTSSSTVLLPTVTINSLANIMAACVNATEYTAGECPTIFASSTPPLTGGAQPTNIFQALMNIAKYPGQNVASLLSDASTTPPFAPSLTTTTVTSTLAPNDLTLGISFPNATLAPIAGADNGPTYIAIDKSDNVFVTGAETKDSSGGTQYLGEVPSSSSASPSAPTYGVTTTSAIICEPETAIIDSSNNIWLGQNYEPSSTYASVVEIPAENMSNAKNISLTDPSGSSKMYEAQNTWAIALDSSNNVWTSSYRGAGSCSTTYAGATSNSLCELEELPVAQESQTTPVWNDTFGTTPTHEITNTTRGLFVDANVTTTTYNGYVWATNYNSNVVDVVNTSGSGTNASGTEITYTVGPSNSGNVTDLLGIALDKSSNAWITVYGSTASNPVTASGLYEVPAGSSSGTAATQATAYSPSSIPNASTSLPASNSSAPPAVGGLSKPKYLAIDGAGNIFVPNYGYNSVVEYSPTFLDGNNGTTAGAYLSPYYGFSPSITVPATALAVTAYSINSSNVVTIYAINTNLSVGQSVTLSGFGTSTFLNGVTLTVASDYGNDFTASSSSFTHGSVSKTTESGTATEAATNQAVFSCTGTTVVCSILNPAASFDGVVAVDKAGSVWTLWNNGTLVEMIGPGAPTDPILSDGKYGVEP